MFDSAHARTMLDGFLWKIAKSWKTAVLLADKVYEQAKNHNVK